MSGGAIAMTVVIVITVGVTAYLVGAMARSIGNEKKTSMRLWKNFGLSLGFCALFFITWVGQGIAQWQTDTEPTLRKDPIRQSETLHVVPSRFEGWMLKDESSSEPEGYYDTQEDAIQGGRELASK
ncbi:MAG: DUF2188 domain-containing protein [Actinomycetota bacterium]